jgi:hypothetical protein
MRGARNVQSRVSGETWEKIEATARQHDTTVAEVVRKALEAWAVQAPRKKEAPVKKETAVALLPEESLWLDRWKETVGTQLRTNLDANAKAAGKLAAELGDHRLQELLMACRIIRADKFAGRAMLFACSNYVSLAKNLEAVEAYAQAKVDQSVIPGK